MTEVAPVEARGRGALAWAVAGIGLAMSLAHLWWIAVAPPDALRFRVFHLGFAVALLFLLYPLSRRGPKAGPRAWDYAAMALAVGCCAYMILRYGYVFNRTPYVDDPEALDLVMAGLCVALVLEGTRRILGWALPLTALVFLGFALLFTQVRPAEIADQLYLTTEGIWGTTLGVSASYVLIFVLFGSFMERTGIGQLFMDFALSLTGTSAGGPGKVAVVSSSLFGTISGSAVANVMVDGPITIPLMKRTGFTPHFGAAVEAVASTGGQIMPPIMGAAAFVMAEFLNVPYLQVVVWAIVPALLYYIACFAAVHFEAKRVGLLGLPRAECPKLGPLLRQRGYLFAPLIVILAVMFSGYSAPLAALAALVSCLAFIMLPGRWQALPFAAGIAAFVLPVEFALAVPGGTLAFKPYSVAWASVAMLAVSVALPLALKEARATYGRRLLVVVDALIDGAKNSLPVAMACAAAGIIIGVISQTGIGIDFTQWLVGFTRDELWIALILTAMAGIVLGMGMPTTAAYIVMVSLLVPAIVKLGKPLGLPDAAAHMFAFYFAILSAITPPVALAVFAAASLAKADLWRTGWAAVRIGAAGFIVPFMFVYEPALLLIGKDWTTMVTAGLTAAIGCVGLAAGLYGYLIRACTLWERLALVAGAIFLINPGLITDAIGIGLFAAVALWQRLGKGRAAAR